MLEVKVNADEPLVEGSSSEHFFLEGGLFSSFASEMSPKRSSNKSHKLEALDQARDATKRPQASFSSRAVLTLRVAASCNMNRD